MAERKKNPEEENDAPAENASPICYANSPELRPGFKEELNKVSDITSDTNKRRNTIKSRKMDKS